LRLRAGTVPVLVVVSLVSAMASGCGPKTAEVTSVWPTATFEATVTPPADVYSFPLTGEPVTEGSSIPTVPVCAKVHDNGSRALSGVGEADVVYETADAGTGTQLACLFQSEIPSRVGPIGDAGMPDLWIIPQYRAMLFSAGATSTLAASMVKWPHASNASRGQGPPFDEAYRGSSNTYLLGPKAAKLATKFTSAITSGTPARLRFSASNQATSSPIAGMLIPFAVDWDVSWAWDEESGSYQRSVRGESSRDALTKEPISAKNVVVLWVRYTSLDPDLAAGAGSDVTLGGSGQMSVFRNGQRFDGRWKASGQSPPRLFASDGSSVGLEAGNTWFEVIPLSANITLQ
jgi:Protein of unknown function (DUF3048) C-terminal domain/Protein of unknown function (DUF3048) N-terminal domain